MSDLALLYDDLTETYAAGRHLFDTTPILREFAGPLPTGAHILDAGCGAGEPVARYFVARGDTVTGILAIRQSPLGCWARSWRGVDRSQDSADRQTSSLFLATSIPRLSMRRMLHEN